MKNYKSIMEEKISLKKIYEFYRSKLTIKPKVEESHGGVEWNDVYKSIHDSSIISDKILFNVLYTNDKF